MHSSLFECRKASVLRQWAVIFPLNIYGQKYIPVHAEVSLCTGAMQGSILAHSKRQEKRLRFDLLEQGILQFSLLEKSSLAFDGFTWASLARAFLSYLLPTCSWKEASFYTWELFCISSAFTHGRNPAGIAAFYKLMCRSCSSFFKSNTYLNG